MDYKCFDEPIEPRRLGMDINKNIFYACPICNRIIKNNTEVCPTCGQKFTYERGVKE